MCPVVDYVLVSLCNIVMIENDSEVEGIWCQIGYLKYLFLDSLITLKMVLYSAQTDGFQFSNELGKKILYSTSTGIR